MGTGKREQYLSLVKKRKEHIFSEGLLNPSEIENGNYDMECHVGPWSIWQGNLDARMLLIGQDWGNIDYYRNNKGYDTDDNPTNKNLFELFKQIEIDIGTPSKPNYSAPVFFTNTILGIKQNGNMSAKVRKAWAKESADLFLAPLIEIIRPKTIITLGGYAYGEVARIYGLPVLPLRELIQKTPFSVGDKEVYAMFHCGGLGLANRKFHLQKEDWSKIVSRI
jgi:Uracil DNA glycosylase superfamily